MFENLVKKISDLNPTIKQLPFTYLGNKYLNNDSDPCITNKMSYNPSSLINSLRANHYNKFKRANSMTIFLQTQK